MSAAFTMHITPETTGQQIRTHVRDCVRRDELESICFTGIVSIGSNKRPVHDPLLKDRVNRNVRKDLSRPRYPHGVYNIKLMGTKTVTQEEYDNVKKLLDDKVFSVIANVAGIDEDNILITPGSLFCENHILAHKNDKGVRLFKTMVQGEFSNFTVICKSIAENDYFRGTSIEKQLKGVAIPTPEHVIQLIKVAFAAAHWSEGHWDPTSARSVRAMEKVGFSPANVDNVRKAFTEHLLDMAIQHKDAAVPSFIKKCGGFAALPPIFKAFDGEITMSKRPDGGFDYENPLQGFSAKMFQRPAANLTTSAACAALLFMDHRLISMLVLCFESLVVIEGAMHDDGKLIDFNWGGNLCARYLLDVYRIKAKQPFYNMLSFGHMLFICCVFPLGKNSDLYPLELRQAALRFAGLDAPIQNTKEEATNPDNWVTEDNTFLNKARFETFVNNMLRHTDATLCSALAAA